MKSATLTRSPSTDQGTFGDFRTDDDALRFDSLELPWRDNATGHSCIPVGEYQCVWHLSPSKGWVYLLTGTAPRTDVLIHSANFAGDVDKGWQSQLLGCITVGMSTGKIKNDKGEWQMAALTSRMACQKLYDWGAQESFTLVISDASA